MKRLFLLRHAKSSWDNPRLTDFDRPLNKRGRKAAARIGRYMAAERLLPELVLCSAARRAQDTWELTAKALGSEPSTKVYRSLYLASPARLLEVIRRQPSEVAALLMVGHNPGIATLVQRLAGPGSESAALGRAIEKYPTGALAELTFEAETWADLALEGTRLRRYVVPRDLD